jgi:integrase/recombinase XerD
MTIRSPVTTPGHRAGVSPAACGLVASWLDERRRLELSRPSVVFCTLDGQPLHKSYVRALLPWLARKAGIEKRVHPHSIRHTCAAELAIEGVPVPLIQLQLGHASLDTTTVNLRHIESVELVETMRRRNWNVP